LNEKGLSNDGELTSWAADGH